MPLVGSPLTSVASPPLQCIGWVSYSPVYHNLAFAESIHVSLSVAFLVEISLTLWLANPSGSGQ